MEEETRIEGGTEPVEELSRDDAAATPGGEESPGAGRTPHQSPLRVTASPQGEAREEAAARNTFAAARGGEPREAGLAEAGEAEKASCGRFFRAADEASLNGESDHVRGDPADSRCEVEKGFVSGSPEAEAARIVDELLHVRVPEGIDTDAAMRDEGFVELLTEYPAAAAVRIWAAERRAEQAPRQVADLLRARQGVPASTRPQQPVRPEPDWWDMTGEEFLALKERVARSLR